MQKRFLELDLLRGLAVMGMIIFHFFFILNFYGIFLMEMNDGLWLVFAQIVRFVFLSLVGVGMVISYSRRLGKIRGGGTSTIDKSGWRAGSLGWRDRWRARLSAVFAQWKRAVVTGLCAALITVVTYFFLPDDYVRFGILHLIAVGIILWSFFLEWKWLVLGLSVASFWVGNVGAFVANFGDGGWLGAGVVGVGGAAGVARSGFGFAFFPGYFLHDAVWNIQALDYFPLFPWIGLIGIGIFLGHLFYPQGQPRFRFCLGERKNQGLVAGKSEVAGSNVIAKTNGFGVGICRVASKVLSFFGRHALLIYMLHVPIILAVLWAVGLVKI